MILQKTSFMKAAPSINLESGGGRNQLNKKKPQVLVSRVAHFQTVIYFMQKQLCKPQILFSFPLLFS